MNGVVVDARHVSDDQRRVVADWLSNAGMEPGSVCSISIRPDGLYDFDIVTVDDNHNLVTHETLCGVQVDVTPTGDV